MRFFLSLTSDAKIRLDKYSQPLFSHENKQIHSVAHPERNQNPAISALSQCRLSLIHNVCSHFPLCSSHKENKMHYHYHGATLSHNEQRTSFLLSIRRLILSTRCAGGRRRPSKSYTDLTASRRVGHARVCFVMSERATTLLCALLPGKRTHRHTRAARVFLHLWLEWCFTAYISV